MGIFVSILIQGNIEDVWEKTQSPSLHQRWDVRFSHIEYVQMESADEPQQFLYESRLGFGIKVSGKGESVAIRDDGAGNRASSLRFWSDQNISLISKGSGYWKYSPTADGILFETGYDYEPRWGAVGKLVDRFVFRPLIAWATAWSFDRLRIWIEDGTSPEISTEKTISHAIARLAIAFTWIWHGLVPKLIAHDPSEILPITRMGIPTQSAQQLVTAAGIAEILFGILIIALWRRQWPLLLSAAAFAMLGTVGLATTPGLVSKAFSPVSLSVALLGLCAIAYISGRDIPSATHCSYSWKSKK
jgi:hypothetical protein